MTGISIQIELSADTRERWEKLIYDRGYAKGAFIRSFIEAVTDPVRGPRVERVLYKTLNRRRHTAAIKKSARQGREGG